MTTAPTIPETRRERFKPVAGDFEPWLIVLVDVATDEVLKARYECPHCTRQFKRRGSCEAHCKGKPPHPASCPKLKRDREKAAA